MRIVAQIRNENLRAVLEQAVRSLDAELVEVDAIPGSNGALTPEPAVVLLEVSQDTPLPAWRSWARGQNAGLVLACPKLQHCSDSLLRTADGWITASATADELALRLRQAASALRTTRHNSSEWADLLRYEEMLYDKLTGFPTLPVMIERGRELLEREGELTALYIHFVWYEKIEETYGWQKLDDVLESTASAIRSFYEGENASGKSLVMVSHVADDDFILFATFQSTPEAAEQRLRATTEGLERHLRQRIEAEHGEDIAALCGIYVGAATIFRNPKIRTERLLYRGIREATQAARGAEEWERSRKVSDLKSTIRDGAVFIEYHPIIVTATEEIYGFEALARGVRRELRSPEVLFEVAEEANLVWELSRLLRQRAIEGVRGELEEGQYLFMNVDPHDFDDPAFRNLDPAELGINDPSRVVLEITERTAIKDYPRFQEYLAAFRDRGFRFAVDDAGSGYAGLGSIANLAPDYIKLDISLISNIDTNFLKQNLVETMVRFADGQGTRVIAEGVERREEFETVRDLGVHLTQGFLFSRPRQSNLNEAPTAARSTAR